MNNFCGFKWLYNKILVAILLTGLIPDWTPLMAQNLPVNVLKTIRSKGVLTVGMESNAPPMNYIDKNNIRKGFDYEMAIEFAKIIGVSKVEVKEADYEVLPGLVRTGEIDIIMGGYVPDPSIENVEWSKGYYTFGLCLIVRKSSAIKNIKHLKGRKVAVYNDPAAEEWVKENIPEGVIKKYSGDSGWFEALENGDVEGLIYDYPFAAAEIKNHPQTVITQFNLNQSAYAVGVVTKNFDLINEINKAIDTVMSSPIYKSLIERYFAYESEEYTKPSTFAIGIKTYTIKRGDALSSIAKEKLGSVNKWKEIWDLNKSRIPDPNLIKPGWILQLP